MTAGSAEHAPLKVGIYLFDNVEVLDFAGPFEVFSTANRVAGPAEKGDAQKAANNAINNTADLFEVFTITAGRKSAQRTIRARGGLQVIADYSISNHPQIDVLIIPGGVVDRETADPAVLAWISRQARQTQLVASVCTGALLLAAAGLLQGKSATTHWQDRQELAERFSDIRVVADARWVDAGRVVTSGGISAGIDMCLYLLSRLHNSKLAKATARQMEYHWHSPAGSHA